MVDGLLVYIIVSTREYKSTIQQLCKYIVDTYTRELARGHGCAVLVELDQMLL